MKVINAILAVLVILAIIAIVIMLITGWLIGLFGIAVSMVIIGLLKRTGLIRIKD